MNEQNHPITPPPNLTSKWNNLPLSNQEILVIAARWGADQELEACCEWIDPNSAMAGLLRAARRPKLPPETIEVDGFMYRLEK